MPVRPFRPPCPAVLPPGYQLRDLQLADTARTGQLHHRYLSLGLFPRLGRRFLTRWHRTFVTSPHAWGAVVTDPEDEVVAVVLVALDQQRYVTGVLTEQRRALGTAAAVALLVRPRVAVHFLRTRARRYARRLYLAPGKTSPAGAAGGAGAGAGTAEAVGTGPLGVVHVVITEEGSRGLGLATALLSAAEHRAEEAGTPVLALVTEAPGPGAAAPAPAGAAGMYDRLGWHRTGVHLRDGRPVAEYRRHLNPT